MRSRGAIALALVGAHVEAETLQAGVAVQVDRQDLGVGERQLTFWLSATEGLLRLAIDGVAYDREP